MQITGDLTRWIVRPRAQPAASARLVCVPYCGGAASVFQSWAARLPSRLDAWLVQLPGRATRFAERPYSAMRPLVEDLAAALTGYVSQPYALFGHSLGALVCFELARELRRRGQPGPVRLFVSGCGAPETRDPFPPIHELPDELFLQEIAHLNGTPAEVLADPDLMRVLLPMLRADFRVVETYSCRDEAPLTCPISVFGGADDPRVSRARLEAWARHTSTDFSLRILPGGHFFLHTARDAQIEAMILDLDRAVGASQAI